jgi:hypothetical protein
MNPWVRGRSRLKVGDVAVNIERVQRSVIPREFVHEGGTESPHMKGVFEFLAAVADKAKTDVLDWNTSRHST